MPKPSPRGPPPPGAAGNRSAGLVVWLMVALLVAVLLRGVLADAGARRVPYSELKEALRSRQVEKVVLSEDQLRVLFAPEPGAGAVPGGRDERAQGRPAADRLWVAYRVPTDEALVPLLEERGIRYEAAATGGLASVLATWVVPFVLAAVLWSWLLRRAAAGLGQGPPGIMGFGKSRARVYAEHNTGVTFADVAGVDEAADELKEVVAFLRTPERFRRLGGRIPRGVLLVGPPGTGKTLLARAVAGEAGVPFFSLSGSEFVEMFVGVGAARVRDLFAQAAARAPCIVFIDELDAIGKARNGGLVTGHDEREQTLNQLLAEMDGFDPRAGLMVMAATNRPEVLDPALLRPGRFDRHVLVDRPDKRGRERILSIHVRGVKLGPDVDLRELAARTPGFAGADLASMVNEAALLAGRASHDHVGQADFDEAIERVTAGLEKKNRRISDQEKEVVAIHEAGHALVATVLPRADRVQKVSIIPRGLSALGYTRQQPLEDRYLLSTEELQDKLAALMGGRAAEEELVGSVSTGAASDLRQATEMARLMVCEYGMSERIGPMSLLGAPRPSFLPGVAAPMVDRTVSEATARLIDAEVARLVGEALHRARAVASHNREQLSRLASRLMSVEVVEGDEVRSILHDAEPPPYRLGRTATAPDDRPVV